MGDDEKKQPRGGQRGPLVGSFQRRNLSNEQEVPVALERVLIKAAANRSFRAALLADRDRALAESGIELRPDEIALLQSMPEQVLATTIDRLKPEKQRNQAFAKAVAATVAGSLVLSSCLPPCGGAAPDWDAGVTADAAADDGASDADDEGSGD